MLWPVPHNAAFQRLNLIYLPERLRGHTTKFTKSDATPTVSETQIFNTKLGFWIDDSSARWLDDSRVPQDRKAFLTGRYPLTSQGARGVLGVAIMLGRCFLN